MKLHDLHFLTQVGPKKKQDKTKKNSKKGEKNQIKAQKKFKVNDNVI
jgi:hypothetical protein